jgi:3',5'-cyclic AMP phosphodiesterase CpdA
MRIAHISDLHLLSLEGVSPLRFLNKRLTGYANLRLRRKSVHRSAYVRAVAREIRRAKVDHVAITGDLTNLALESEFELARKVLEEELGLDPRDVSIVPGNHDLYTRGALESRRFARFFAEYIQSDLPELGVDMGVGRFPFVKLRGPAAIIGMSSAVPRPPFVAAGKLGARQMDALVHILAHPEVKRRTPVFLLHHPLHNPESRLKTLLEGLSDAAVMWTSLKHVPRGLVLHGHLHQRIQRALPTDVGRLYAIGATSASLHHSSPARMAGFNLYEISEQAGEIGSIEAHVFDPDRGSFRAESVPKLV